MAASSDTYADIILPLALPGYFTYYVPDEMVSEVQPGCRVVVQFARKRLYTAIVREVHHRPPKGYSAKYILETIRETPPVVARQLAFWDWISGYYLCHPGEVMAAALPSGLRLSSETRIMLPEEKVEDRELSDDEFLVYEALQVNPSLDVGEVQAILGRQSVYPLLRTMLEKGAVILEETLKEKYKPRLADYVRLAPAMQTDAALNEAFTSLQRAPKQETLLMAYLDLKARGNGQVWMKKKTLLERAGGNQVALTGLADKGILECRAFEEDRVPHYEGEVSDDLQLSPLQQEKYEQITGFFEEKKNVLLHGVTGSGKTEVYIRLIRDALDNGKQALYMLPEIALTTQIIGRLQAHFGDEVGVYHSRLNENERVEVWRKVLDKKIRVLLGARSALFLPFDNLGLVVIDEEHDGSFKQHDPAPRYHGRDAALVLAHMHGARAILGSATPSLESYYNAQQGKYGLVEMQERFGEAVLPDMQVVDLADAERRKRVKGSFSFALTEAIEKTLAGKEQVILFQNRRGFSPFIECNACGWVPQCEHCDVSLTYHKAADLLRCHYCGYSTAVPAHCLACHSPTLQTKGLGTEKVEEELALLFPQARIMRMDLDSTRTKHGHRNIINAFENREVDVLVGTQMVTKGLHFDHVGLVGILNADHAMNLPDFRAFERAYQLMVQVSGRAGRKKKKGTVVIQSRNPQHPVIRHVLAHDGQAMSHAELQERRQYGYPPFTRLIRLTLRHRQEEALFVAAQQLGGDLRKKFGARVLGPEPPVVARIRGYYLQHLLLKMEKELPLERAKEALVEILDKFSRERAYKTVRVGVDVDPV